MFPRTAKEVAQMAEEQHTHLGTFAIRHESEETGASEEAVRAALAEQIRIMKVSATEGRRRLVFSLSGLIGGDSTKVSAYAKRGTAISGEVMVDAVAYAMSSSEVNASMGRIVAAPTAGACGILPAVLKTFSDRRGTSEEELVDALAVAGAMGIIIGQNATISGAEGGCQAETGAAAAMAAGAAVHLLGGTPSQCLDSGAIVLMNMLGLVCDPVAGLVEIPCVYRNAQGAVNALTTADMVMAGVRSRIPFDEAVTAMYEVGRSLSEALRETGIGGIAGTPTGQRLKRQVFGDAPITEVHKDYKQPREEEESSGTGFEKGL
ncbi:L-serine dehydratase, alpha subunit [Clostridiaceae bacterium JG1575]|nr:L-serine dehydratase, alpha subunit [Clostridiaceae bacterium JG1575]